MFRQGQGIKERPARIIRPGPYRRCGFDRAGRSPRMRRGGLDSLQWHEVHDGKPTYFFRKNASSGKYFYSAPTPTSVSIQRTASGSSRSTPSGAPRRPAWPTCRAVGPRPRCTRARPMGVGLARHHRRIEIVSARASAMLNSRTDTRAGQRGCTSRNRCAGTAADPALPTAQLMLHAHHGITDHQQTSSAISMLWSR